MEEVTKSHLGYDSRKTLHRKIKNILANELFLKRKKNKGFLDGYFPEIRSDLNSCMVSCLIT